MRVAPAQLAARGARTPTSAAHAAGWVELARDARELVAPEDARVVIAGGSTVVLAGAGALHVLGPCTPRVTHGQAVRAGELVATTLLHPARWSVATRGSSARAWDEPALVVTLEPRCWLAGHDAAWPMGWPLDPTRRPTLWDDAYCGEVVS